MDGALQRQMVCPLVSSAQKESLGVASRHSISIIYAHVANNNINNKILKIFAIHFQYFRLERFLSFIITAGTLLFKREMQSDQAHVAQSVEHVLGKDEVTGSIPVVGSIFC